METSTFPAIPWFFAQGTDVVINTIQVCSTGLIQQQLMGKFSTKFFYASWSLYFKGFEMTC